MMMMVVCLQPTEIRTGSVGRCLPGTELRFASDGELQYRGPHVSAGYYKNPSASAETFVDGWLYSGDVGRMDSDGYVYITDRKKELIITAGGENVPPAVIEAQLKAIPIVNQVVVIGDQRKFITALFTLNTQLLPALLSEIHSAAKDAETAATDKVFLAYLQGEVTRINASIASNAQTIKKFTVLPQELSIEGGELTPTLKLKRRIINQKYKTQIDAMYNEAE